MASIVRGDLDGAQFIGHFDEMSLSRIHDDEIRRARSLEMYRMWVAEVPVKKIARKYRLSVGYVYQEMRRIPRDVKERARRAVQVSVG